MSEYADLILLSNCIFTATEEIPFSGYIAIKNFLSEKDWLLLN